MESINKTRLLKLDNFTPTDEKHMTEDDFVKYLDLILDLNYVLNQNVCPISSSTVMDYFIIVDYREFLYKIPNKLIESLKLCFNQNIRFYILPIKVIFNKTDAHSNLIIIDNHTKTVEYFEPHGHTFKGNVPIHYETEFISIDILYNILPFLDLYNYKNIQEEYMLGLQYKQNMINIDSGYCLAWSLLIIQLRILNVELHTNDIITDLLSMTSKELDLYIRKYITFIKSENHNSITKKYSFYNNIKIPLSDREKHDIKNRIIFLLDDYFFKKHSDKSTDGIMEELSTYNSLEFFDDLFFQQINKLSKNYDYTKFLNM